ncbi:MAG: hypothetical protein ACI4JK_06980 [Oscillospiraceae bacterium]
MDRKNRLYFSDEGILSSGKRITADEAALIGRGASRLSRSIVVGVKASPTSEALALAFSAAALECGADILFAGNVSLPELFYISNKTDEESIAVYISSVFYPSFRFFRRGGGELSRDMEEMLFESDNMKTESFEIGKISDISSFRVIYVSHLKKLLGVDSEKYESFPYSVVVNSPSERIRLLFSEVLPKVEGKEVLAFHISEDGVKCTAFTESTGYIQCGKLMMLALKYHIKDYKGNVFKIPKDISGAAEKIAAEYGVKLERSQEAELDFYYDKILLIIEIIRIIQKTGQKLYKLCEDLPKYAELDRYIPIEKESSTEKIKTLCNEYKNGKNYILDKDFSGGVTINDALGKISVTPIRSGKGIMLHAESTAMESAAELCDHYERILHGEHDFR